MTREFEHDECHACLTTVSGCTCDQCNCVACVSNHCQCQQGAADKEEELDKLVEKASVPNLGALFRAGREAGYIGPSPAGSF